ncbi:MAG: Lrp/AsnC family transcriptional regulator [Clostridiales Family XIII bacterium]|jgi:Lrp/AsnC family leucine-responsive transcriptional regulator|nr:Lrp/AsnC family transcriptional regulator [Clostridiales Family XIII bacterium]
MDDIDKHILTVMLDNARIPLSDLSKQINLSLPATSERLRKLEKRGFIKSYVTLLDPEKTGRAFSCFCLVKMKEHSASDATSLIDFAEKSDEIMACHHITGAYNYLLKIMTRSSKDMEQLIKRMQTELKVSNTDTFIVLNTLKDTISVLPD